MSRKQQQFETEVKLVSVPLPPEKVESRRAGLLLLLQIFEDDFRKSQPKYHWIGRIPQ